MDVKKDVNVKEKETQGDEPKNRAAAPHKLIKRYVLFSMGAGLIPIPWLDLGTLAGVQLKMLHRLSRYYGVQFSENKGKSIIAALVGTITADSLKRGAFTSFIKTIPVLGYIGVFSMPIYAGATTYAIGKVFVQHFESGGTFLDFDPQKVKDYFAHLYEEGKIKASKLSPEKA